MTAGLHQTHKNPGKSGVEVQRGLTFNFRETTLEVAQPGFCPAGCCLCVRVCMFVCGGVCVCPLTACLCSYTTSIKRFINMSIKAHSPALLLCPPITHMYVCSCTSCHPGTTWHCPASPYTNMAPVAFLGTPKHSCLTQKSLGPSVACV